MFYDEINNDDYNPLEDTGSTEYWQNEWDKEKKEKEEEEKRLSEEVDLYFKCSNPKCGYVTKTKEKVELRYVDGIIASYKKATCPACGNKGLKQIEKKEYEKLEKEYKEKKKKNKNEEEIDVKKIETGIKKNIADDVEDLLEDLSIRLLDGKMSAKAFVNIFYKISMNITTKYYKEFPGGVDVSTYNYYRKIFLNLSDRTLDRYNVQENAEIILQSYDIEIEENKEYLNELYDAQYGYYIDDEKYSIADFEMKERIEEYDNQKNNIFKQEEERQREEEYQQRRKQFEEKYEKRMKNRDLRRICK